jgi:hypothetical protein
MTFRLKTGGCQLSLAPVSAPTMFNRLRFPRLNIRDDLVDLLTIQRALSKPSPKPKQAIALAHERIGGPGEKHVVLASFDETVNTFRYREVNGAGSTFTAIRKAL